MGQPQQAMDDTLYQHLSQDISGKQHQYARMMSQQHDKDKAAWQRKTVRQKQSKSKAEASNMTVANLATQGQSHVTEERLHDGVKAT